MHNIHDKRNIGLLKTLVDFRNHVTHTGNVRVSMHSCMNLFSCVVTKINVFSVHSTHLRVGNSGSHSRKCSDTPVLPIIRHQLVTITI